MEEFHPVSFRMRIARNTGASGGRATLPLLSSHLFLEPTGHRRRSSGRGSTMASATRPVQCEPAARPPVIHVVDDDPGFRAAIGDLLRACDYRVELHASATDLLEKPPGD